ncbi:MAG: hypothetical protein OI74_11360 [Gammaproteobacteria bacterium (ex Lamellibrachia satsuma)]|nr:MAG: hypothetical protein HPY30_11310 [Gammaproteobacteria bacterium (ex Lamellibrachia satsuma)]RRS32422.1 MAG: hypothetical protein OI74_11360 [Gammaproteobacteria bacterium (ex Lamellibrachia satsuma)]RRS34517.1 MAG: hypothetical protein NV67_12775 [Gammaproteobacteria bacterium (ex Lamellibrachia satsuma)]
MHHGQIKLIFGMIFFLSATAHAEQTLLATKVGQPPVIDGKGGDPAWSQTTTITTHARVADIPVELQAVHDEKRLYLKARFPDPTENLVQKNLVWDKENELYRTGPKREDTFVIKWSMEESIIDLSLSANAPYKADIWYWKAHRTDHAGRADDKHQIYSTIPMKKSSQQVAKSGQVFHLARRSDAGRSAYKKRIVIDYEGDDVRGLILQTPEGSRADVAAKGEWKKGFWTIEFARTLDSRHADDQAISKDKPVQFGISRYEIAGRNPDPDLEQPNYGSGEVGETLFLQLQ